MNIFIDCFPVFEEKKYSYQQIMVTEVRSNFVILLYL